MELDERIATLRTTLRTLFPVPTEVAELRLLFRGRKGGQSIYFTTDDAGLQDMAEQAVVLDGDGDANLYFGLNPRVPNLRGTAQSGKAEHVTRRRWLLVDADPGKPPANKDDATTDAEKATAKAAIRRVTDWLCKEQGWPVPALVCDSGNGYHALWAVDLEPESTLLTSVLAVLHERFSTPECKIDPALHDAPRICRLYGTTNRKGNASAERPHRRSRVRATSDRAVVPPAKLLAVAAKAATVAVKSTRKPAKPTKNPCPNATEGVLAQARAWMREEEPAVSGEGGHPRCFAVACGLVRDWGLSREEAASLLAEYSDRCDPPWSERELEHKLDGAERAAAEEPDRVGWRARKAVGEDREKGPRQTDYDALVALAKGAGQLWTTPDGEPFATVIANGIQQHLSILESPFEDWLLGAFLEASGRVPKDEAITQAAKSAGRLARLAKDRHEAHVRVAWEGRHTVWVDLCDDTWRAVRVRANGWDVMANPPVRFRRSPLLAPLPEPVRSADGISLLRPLVNVTDDDWPALLAFLVGCLMPPPSMYAILCPHGQQGSGKSTLTSQVAAAIDPRTDKATAGVPTNTDALMLVAEASWLQKYDNASGVTQAQSDLLCTLVSGNSTSKRTLYMNKGLTVVSARRPVILNGIAVTPTSSDLLSRCLPLGLQPPRGESGEGGVRHRTDDELAAAVEAVRPAVLGGLYDAVACALKHYGTTMIADPPRLHDFLRWATAAEPALGLPTGAVEAAMRRTRQEAQTTAVDSSPLPRVLRAIIGRRPLSEWEVSAADWYAALNEEAPHARHGRAWPKDARDFGQQLARIAPDLPAAGMTAVFRRVQGKRLWRVAVLPNAASETNADAGANHPTGAGE